MKQVYKLLTATAAIFFVSAIFVIKEIDKRENQIICSGSQEMFCNDGIGFSITCKGKHCNGIKRALERDKRFTSNKTSEVNFYINIHRNIRNPDVIDSMEIVFDSENFHVQQKSYTITSIYPDSINPVSSMKTYLKRMEISNGKI